MEQTEQHKPCIECGEPIRQEARRCPHCHGAQRVDRVGLIGTVVKWCSGIAVVVSVVMALGNLTRVVDSWVKDDIYAGQLAESAQMAMQQGDNKVAEALLTEAAKLKPSSDEVRRNQIKLAMLTVQKRFAILSNSEFEPINEAYTVLYKNIAFDEGMRNDVLAHIGWAAALTGKNNPEYYFDQVLEDKPDHFYALVFKAFWMVSDMVSLELRDTLTREERYLKAKQLFKKARQADSADPHFVLRRQLEAARRYADVAGVDYPKLAINQQADIEMIGVYMVKNVRSELSKRSDDAIYKGAMGDNTRFDLLVGGLSDEEIEQLINFIGASGEIYHQILAEVLRGRYLQSKGDFAIAYEAFTSAYQKYGSDFGSHRIVKTLPKLINRLCENEAWDGAASRCSSMPE